MPTTVVRGTAPERPSSPSERVFPPKVLLLTQDAVEAIPEDPVAPTVLVIEDDDDFRNIVSLRLSEAGFDVVGVHDAGAAWHVARRHPIQAVVVDFRLPGIDGRTLARQLKNILPAVSFIGFTAWPDDLTVSTSPFDVVHSKPDVEPVIASLRRYTSTAP